MTDLRRIPLNILQTLSHEKVSHACLLLSLLLFSRLLYKARSGSRKIYANAGVGQCPRRRLPMAGIENHPTGRKNAVDGGRGR